MMLAASDDAARRVVPAMGHSPMAGRSGAGHMPCRLVRLPAIWRPRRSAAGRSLYRLHAASKPTTYSLCRVASGKGYEMARLTPGMDRVRLHPSCPRSDKHGPGCRPRLKGQVPVSRRARCPDVGEPPTHKTGLLRPLIGNRPVPDVACRQSAGQETGQCETGVIVMFLTLLFVLVASMLSASRNLARLAVTGMEDGDCTYGIFPMSVTALQPSPDQAGTGCTTRMRDRVPIVRWGRKPDFGKVLAMRGRRSRLIGGNPNVHWVIRPPIGSKPASKRRSHHYGVSRAGLERRRNHALFP